MTRRHPRAALLGAAAASLALVASCQAPGNPGYVTMRFGLERSDGDGALPGPAVPGAPGQGALGQGTPVEPPSGPPFLATATLGAPPGPPPEPTVTASHPAHGPGTATITLDLRGALAGGAPAAGTRRLMATVADIDTVVVTVTPSQGAEVSQTIPASSLTNGVGTIAISGLPPVGATVTIKAYDVFGNEIGGGTQQIVIDPVNPTIVNFTVTLNPTYIPATGTISGGVTIVDGPVIVGTPPPGTVFRTGQVIASATSINGPEGITFDSAGTAWVPAFVGDRLYGLNNKLVVGADYPIRVATTVQNPTDIAFDPLGGMWVANYAAGTVTNVDKTTGKTIRTIAVGLNPADIEFDAAGNMYVVLHVLDSILKISALGIPAPLIPAGLPAVPVPGKKPTFPLHLPISMKVGPNGDLWVVNMKSDTVFRMTSAGVPIAQIDVGDEPEALAFDSAGNPWVTNNRSGNVMKIDKTLNKVSQTYAVGQRPRGLAFDKQGHMWIACSTDNQVVRISQAGVVLGKYKTALDPRVVAVDSAGAIWVGCHTGDTIQKFAP